MLRRTGFLIIFICSLMILTNILYIPRFSHQNNLNQNVSSELKYQTIQEGAENIIVTYVNRRVDVDLYGLIKIRDIITIKNQNNNPISSILIGIPLNHSGNLIYFESNSANEETLLDESTLFTDRLNMVMNEYEMFKIYFESPLLPFESKTIIFRQVMKDLLQIYNVPESGQPVYYFNYNGLIYPILPYKLVGDIIAYYFFPEFGNEDEDITDDWGYFNPSLNARTYDFTQISSIIGDDFIEPLLTNLDDYGKLKLWAKHATSNKIEVEEINREIYISPWGITRIRENVLVKNYGLQVTSYILFYIPHFADGLQISDDLGEIAGISVNEIPGTNTKRVSMELAVNRVRMLTNSSFRFNIEYNLPFENYSSINWFQESFKIDTITTTFDYLVKEQTINIIIDGCLKIDDISESPDAVRKSQGMMTLIYNSDYVVPDENKIIQFTFTIDLFNLLLRPVIFIILIVLIASIYVVLLKTRKKEKDIIKLKAEYIPINEIREFCSLNEEKNALILEIRQAEEDTRRKKIAKKTYKNIINKNTTKIDEIQREIIPFKKSLIDSGDIFENIVKRLDVLEAERISVKDSLSLLESRYKRGRLPSRAAFLKLSDDFKKRRKKIDRTIDKLIQQLRSYLL